MTAPRERPQSAPFEARWLDRRRRAPDNPSPLPQIRRFPTRADADGFVALLRATIPQHELIVQILRPRPGRRQ
jgi:hypothetical protein